MRRLRLPPMILHFPVFFPTFRDLHGQLRCWWHDAHEWVEDPKEAGTYRTWTCKRCRNHVTVFGADGHTLHLKDHGYKRVLVSYQRDPMDFTCE